MVFARPKQNKSPIQLLKRGFGVLTEPLFLYLDPEESAPGIFIQFEFIQLKFLKVKSDRFNAKATQEIGSTVIAAQGRRTETIAFIVTPLSPSHHSWRQPVQWRPLTQKIRFFSNTRKGKIETG